MHCENMFVTGGHGAVTCVAVWLVTVDWLYLYVWCWIVWLCVTADWLYLDVCYLTTPSVLKRINKKINLERDMIPSKTIYVDTTYINLGGVTFFLRLILFKTEGVHHYDCGHVWLLTVIPWCMLNLEIYSTTSLWLYCPTPQKCMSHTSRIHSSNKL